MNKTTIKIEGKDYILDIDKAKELKLLTEEKTIKDFAVGDAFKLVCGTVVVVVTSGYKYANSHDATYSIIGLDGLRFFCDMGINGFTKERMLAWLNQGTKTFVKNINADFIDLLETISNQ